MNYSKSDFISAVLNATEHTVDHIDSRTGCGCHYVRHWVLNMDRGRWNPGLNEMDHELRDVHTPEELYDFLINRP